VRIPICNYNIDAQWRISSDGYLYRENTNIGIGTSTPDERLVVDGVVSLGYESTPDITDLHGKLYVNSAGELHFLSATLGDINLNSISDYELASVSNGRWAELNSQTQDLRTACDGYGAPDTTIIDAHWAELNNQTQNLRDACDGYASGLTADLNWAELNTQTQALRNACDGYSDLITGIEDLEVEHYQQQNDILVTIIKDLDGYALDTTVDSNWAELNNQTQELRDTCDGYATTIAVEANWAELNDQTQNLRNACDGYGAPDTTTIDAHWAELNNQTQQLRNAADGYALDSTVDSNWIENISQSQDIRDSLDGYALLDGSKNFDLIKFDQSQIKPAGDGLVLRNSAGDGYMTLLTTGDLEINGGINNPVVTYTPVGTTQEINLNNSNSFILDLGSAAGNVSLNFFGERAGSSFFIVVIQDSAVAVDVVWQNNVLWSDGVTPVISTGAATRDCISFIFDGSYFYGSIGKNFS